MAAGIPKEFEKTAKIENITAIMIAGYCFLSDSYNLCISIIITTEIDKSIYMHSSSLVRAISDE